MGRGAHRFEQVQRAEDVRRGVGRRIGDTYAHVNLRGQMAHDVEPPLSNEGGRFGAADVEFVKRGCDRHDVATASGEVVDHRQVVTCSDQGVRDVRADEAGAAGDEGTRIGHAGKLMVSRASPQVQGIFAVTLAAIPRSMPASRCSITMADAPHGVTLVTCATPTS